MSWEFTADEFMHLWKETGRDRYPFPLRLISSVRWQSEAERLGRELADRLPPGGDPDLSAVLRVAAEPALTLAITGTRKRPIRAYAAVDTTVGVTVVQRPGTTADYGGNVVIEVGSPAIVPKVLCAVLGNTPAGRHSPLIESVDRIRTSLESWTGSKESVTDRMRRLLAAPRVGSGHIEAQPGLRSQRAQPPEYLSWFDVENDGRYLYRQRYNDFQIEPWSPEQVRGEMGRLAGIR